MTTIEPNVSALLWFAAFASVTSLSFYALTGAFPLETRPDLRSRPLAMTLIAVDVLLLGALVVASLFYGFSNLRWTSVVIVGGLAVLFAPSLFNLWPGRLRDGVAGLAIVCAALAAVAAALPTAFSVDHV